MKCKNIFFVLSASVMFVSVTHAMIVKTKRMSNVFCKIQQRNNSRPFDIRVGKDSVSFYSDALYTSKDLAEMYEDIKELGAKKCENFLAERILKADACNSPICCGGALLLGMQKNIQAARRSHAIRQRFLENVEKKGRVAYLEDIKDLYIDLIQYRVILNEFCNADRSKRLVLYSMISNINACLFNQAQVILEDSFDTWKEDHFKMTSKIKQIREIRDDISEWYENEKEYKDAIVDEQAKIDYRNALVGNRTVSYKLSRIDEEYKLLHCGKNQTRE